MATFSERQIRGAQRSRALFVLVAVILAALTSMHFADGADLTGAMPGFAAALFTASAVMATKRIGLMKKTVALDEASAPQTGGWVVTGPAEFIPLQAGMITMNEFRERMSAFPGFSPTPAAIAPRPAWDVSMTLSQGPWSDVVQYDDATSKPDGFAFGVIRVIPRDAIRTAWQPFGKPVVISWTVVTRAASNGEGVDLLKAAEPLLRDELWNRYRPEARYFRIVNGALAEVPDGLAVREAEASARPAAPAVRRPDSGAVRLDPRWEWRRVQGAGGHDQFVKVRCLHSEVVDVESAVDKDKIVAQLCETCGTRFPAPVSGPADDWPAGP